MRPFARRLRAAMSYRSSQPPSDYESIARPGGRIERLRQHLHVSRPHLGILGLADDLMHYLVALVLLAVAAVVLYRTGHDLATTHLRFSEAATSAVNSVLFAIIILEVMRTVIAHFDEGGLQLQPFLIIGIISAVREILTVGARLSLQGASGPPTTTVIHDALLELGVNASVVLGLALALVLVRRFANFTTPD